MEKSQKDIFSLQTNLQSKIRGYSYRQREGADFPEDSSAKPLGLSFNRSYLMAGVLVTLFIGLTIFGRVFYLQIIKGDYYAALAEGNSTKLERTLAPRGLIYDRNLTPLVKNEPVFLLKIVPENLPNQEDESQKVLATAAMMLKNDSNFTEVENILGLLNTILSANADYPVVLIADNLDHETALRFKLEDNLPGILLEQSSVRSYLHDKSLSHVIGYLGSIRDDEWDSYQATGYYYGDLVGRTGLEKFYESKMRGTDEIVRKEVNVKGEEQKLVTRDSIIAGDNLVLAIDNDLQNKLAESLFNYARQTSGKAAAVAMNPNTGEILALVSLPNYDNNAFESGDIEVINSYFQDEKQPLFNRVISGMYPPGSTFKPVVAAAALDQGIVTPNTSFYSSGGLQINEWFFPDWKSGGHGRTNLYKAIAESVNTYFYYIGGGFEDFTGLGVNKINQYAHKFGLNNPLGIDLPGEAGGFLPSKSWKEKNKHESWYIGDTYHLSIGQGDILLTPLQLAVVTSIFANGGQLYQPYIVKSITNSSGELFEMHEPILVDGQVLPKEHINSVRRAYRETVLSGSAISLQALPVSSAGKTGTAQVGGGEPHGWFTGWAPYENPEIVLTVLVENGIGGNTSALPVFRDVLNWYFLQ